MRNYEKICTFMYFLRKPIKIFLYNIGQGQWVSLVGLGRGGGFCIYKYKYMIDIKYYYITLDKANG